MTDLSAFPVTARWPAENPDVLQLYSFPTPNGVKISIMLEETGLPYEAALLVAAFLRAFMLLASVSFGTLYAFEPAQNKLKKMQAIDTP